MPIPCYSLAHLLVDALCAFAMTGRFIAQEYNSVLVYNFCAFALQFPLGALADLYASRIRRTPEWFALAGAALTVLGCFLSPVLLGLGNALFHVGGGIAVIGQDDTKHWSGRALGVFVAPGAFGLYLGRLLAGQSLALPLLAVPMGALVLAPLFRRIPAPTPAPAFPKLRPVPTLCALLVVALRSFVGLTVVFSWRSSPLWGLFAVLATVFGKALGGFAAARFGSWNTSVVSLVLAMGFFFLGGYPIPGLLALFLFNMTMPITLYRQSQFWAGLPGSAFGLLTLGLFLGFLPVFFGVQLPLSPETLGALGCLASLVLLYPVTEEKK